MIFHDAGKPHKIPITASEAEALLDHVYTRGYRPRFLPGFNDQPK